MLLLSVHCCCQCGLPSALSRCQPLYRYRRPQATPTVAFVPSPITVTAVAYKNYLSSTLILLSFFWSATIFTTSHEGVDTPSQAHRTVHKPDTVITQLLCLTATLAAFIHLLQASSALSSIVSPSNAVFEHHQRRTFSPSFSFCFIHQGPSNSP